MKSIVGGGFQPGDFDFNDGSVPYTTNTVTFTKSGTLYLLGNPDGNADYEAYCYKNNIAQYFYFTEADAITYQQSGGGGGVTLFLYNNKYAVIPVEIGDTMYFSADAFGGPEPGQAIVSFFSDTFNGTLISDFTITYGGCYLTTATVNYKGLQDDGPELTTMRSLREYYRGDPYYDNLITEYYINSPIILQGINSSKDPSMEYEFIYQSVLRVKYFVDNLLWEDAKNEYVNTYLILKNKYI